MPTRKQYLAHTNSAAMAVVYCDGVVNVCVHLSYTNNGYSVLKTLIEL